MAIIKASKMKEMGEKEIDEKVHELKLELSKEIGFSEIGTVKNPGRVREIKKTIARLLTKKTGMEKSALETKPVKKKTINTVKK